MSFDSLFQNFQTYIPGSILLLLLLTIFARFCGALLRTYARSFVVQLAGWLLCAVAAWFAAMASGAWPVVWALALVVAVYLLIAAYFKKRSATVIAWFTADFTGVAILGWLSIPSLTLQTIILAALLTASVGFAIDFFVQLSSKPVAVGTLGFAFILSLIISIVQPSLVTGSLRLLKDRILPTEPTAYLEMTNKKVERTLSFTNTTDLIAVSSSDDGYDFVFRDINLDGRTDLVPMGEDGINYDNGYLQNNDGQSFTEADLPDGDYPLDSRVLQGSLVDNKTLLGAAIETSSIFTDLDSDGDRDLIGITSQDTVVTLSNDGSGQFSEALLTSIGFEEGMKANSITSADVNNDGSVDLLIINKKEALLYANDGEARFNYHQRFSPSPSSSASFVDLDNDSDLDLYFLGDTQVYLNNGQGDFSDGPPIPVGELRDPQSMSFADMDNDGDLDFVLNAQNSQSQLIRNDFNGGNWLKVHLGSLQEKSSNMGATIALYPAQETHQIRIDSREVGIDTTDANQYENTFHFGLGDHELVDVVIDYPDGSSSVRENISSGQTILIDGTDNDLDMVGYELTPYVEWNVENDQYAGNPFDLVASVKFTHEETKAIHETEMFYANEKLWKFRFTATQPGLWSFSTTSQEPNLNGISGEVFVYPNSAPGFITHFDTKWGRTGTDEAFVPQYVMYSGPQDYYGDPGKIEADIQTFIVEHGFTGFNTPVFCRWFDISQRSCNDIHLSDPNPDLRTFEALEQLILQVYQAGGVVHIWAWGDDSRGENPKRWGINGAADRRLQRYVAARLGPLPGWSMGYGYDLWEWVSSEELTEWHSFMHDHFGWPHYLGARSHKNKLDQLSEAMDYSSYEQHRPDYNAYAKTVDMRPGKPSFSEDRFRIRDEGRDKDYTMEDTRRGLWRSAMAGGVANIWGNVTDAPGSNEGLTPSAPYPNPEWIKTYANFFDGRFTKDLARCSNDGRPACLKSTDSSRYIFYQEDATAVNLEFTADGRWNIIAVDTKKPYEEIPLNKLDVSPSTWTPPYRSDWAIAATKY